MLKGITQSTEEGEENSNQTIYTCGKATEIRSGNNVVTYEYDHKGRITKVGLNGTDYLETKYSDGSGSNNDVITSKYVPREEDNLSDIFEVTKNKHGDVICVKYGKADKAVEKPTLTEEYTYEYDGKFRMTGVRKNGNQLESYTYDTLDRETKHEFNGHIHKTEYGDYGEVEKEVIEYDGSTTDKTEYTYSYSGDSARRLTGQTADGYTESYETDCLGRSRKVTQTLGGKTYSKRYGYYKVGDHATNLINTIYYGKDGKTFGKETYTYDGMGNIVSVSRDGKQKKAYTYDALNRIISEKDIDNEQEICYTYDNNGNILTKSVNGVVTSYAYEEGTDRLTSYGAETIGYDGMGNPKSYRGSELTWEKGRRLTSIKEGPEEVTFGYDVFGQRNKKTAGGETTNYIYENGKLLRQITGSEVMTFIYGSEGIIGFKLGTSRYLYRKNVFGDVEEIYDESGTLVGKYSYTAFGECEIETDANGIATKNPIRYRGYYFDEETGFYYLKTRYYDPETGRFITIDDVSYLAPDTINGLNLYAYCGNNPINYYDPDGHWAMPNWLKWVIGGVVIIGLGIATIATGGAAAGVAGFIVAGAFKGAVIGAVSGALVSGAISGIISAVAGNGFWSGFADGAADGFVLGAIIGGITGAISSSVQVANAAKMWQAGTSPRTSTPFKTMRHHYKTHVINEGFKKGNNVVKYTKDAINFANRNASVLKFQVPYKSGLQPFWTWIGKVGMNGQFTSAGKILTFWYVSL